MITNILLVCIVLGLGFIGWKVAIAPTTSSEDDLLKRKNEEIGDLKSQVQKTISERDELSGKNKQLFAELTNAKADGKAIASERDLLQKSVTKFETEKERKEKDYEQMVEKLSQAEKNFESEKARVIREDEERRAEEMETKDRLWAEHENKVVSELSELCNQPQYSFASYDNTNLPDGFHGTLKPDFMIEFLEQYVIFDAKVSNAKNLQVYIRDQVQKTARKVKGNASIYSSVFLVVPSMALKELKVTSYYEEGFSFFVVSPESIPPILALFKKIESYEFAEAMDPQERENIVDLIAAFHFHISSRNAHELGLMLHGLETLSKAEKTLPEITAEAIVKKAKMRNLNLSTADTKELVANPEHVAAKLLELVEPKAKITKEELGDV